MPPSHCQGSRRPPLALRANGNARRASCGAAHRDTVDGIPSGPAARPDLARRRRLRNCSGLGAASAYAPTGSWGSLLSASSGRARCSAIKAARAASRPCWRAAKCRRHVAAVCSTDAAGKPSSSAMHGRGLGWNRDMARRSAWTRPDPRHLQPPTPGVRHREPTASCRRGPCGGTAQECCRRTAQGTRSCAGRRATRRTWGRSARHELGRARP